MVNEHLSDPHPPSPLFLLCSYATSVSLGMAIVVSVLKEHAEFYAGEESRGESAWQRGKEQRHSREGGQAGFFSHVTDFKSLLTLSSLLFPSQRCRSAVPVRVQGSH